VGDAHLSGALRSPPRTTAGSLDVPIADADERQENGRYGKTCIRPGRVVRGGRLPGSL